jgi:argininosuccinate lyase
MPFDPDYARIVLRENFTDAKTLFLEPLLAIHYAHLAMLAEQSIVSTRDARKIRAALDEVDVAAVQSATYDGTSEDLFFHVERLLVATGGDEVTGHLHTARSRNDIDMTMYRMRLREFVLALAEATLALRRSLIEVAGHHRETLFPAHTHTQPAQPTTLAHYLLAAIEEREHDLTRLMAAFASTNRCPLGACAITGTGFPIDRQRTSDLLGFDGPTGNTYGSIASVDYLLESAAAAAVTVAGVGRLVQDLLLWCTREMGYLRLPDGFVQSSSIMPQKRNPVGLEHARALASKALGQASAIPLAVHNTPFGDIVDTEDDLQPLVASMFKNATGAVTLLAAALVGAEFSVRTMRARAMEGWVTVTELADTLARDHGVAFRTGHAIAAHVVRAAGELPNASLSALVAAASRELAGREIRLTDEALTRILSPDHFVAVRRTWGGPAAEVTGPALAVSGTQLATDETELARRRARLADAATRRRHAVDAL